MIDSHWKTSEMNRRAKYYRLTAAGRLLAEQSKWNLLLKTISRVMPASEVKYALGFLVAGVSRRRPG